MSLVQQVSGASSAPVSSLVLTFPSAVGSGHTVMLSIGHYRDPTTTVSVSGLSGGSWVSDLNAAGPNGRNRLKTYRRIGVTSGTTITIAFGATVDAAAAIAAEFDDNVSTILPQPDGATSLSGNLGFGDPSPHVPFATTHTQRDLLWAASCVIAGGLLPLTDSTWTAVDDIETGGAGFQVAVAAAWRGQYQAGSYNPSWAGSGVDWIAHGLGLKLVGPAAALSAAPSLGAGEMHAMLTAPHSSSIPASPVALPERWMVRPEGQADWTDLSNWAYLVTKVAGADAHPGLRGDDAPFTSLEGRQHLGKRSDGRTVPIALYVMPMNAAGGLTELTDRRQARANLDALQAILAVRSRFELLRVMPDGNGRAALVEVTGVQPIQDRGTGLVFGLMVDFFLADPWFYGLTISDTRTISASPTTFTITHPGSVPSDLLIIEALGPLTGLRLTNLRNGHILEYLPALTSAQRLIVNVREQTARVNGASVLGSLTHYGPVGRAELFRLEPGDNSIEVIATALGGSTVLTLRPAYV